MIDDLMRKKIIDKIKTAPNDAALSDYLLQCSKALAPTRFDSKTITVKNSILEILKEKSSPFSVKLTLKPLDELASFFFLTSGLHIIGALSGHGKTYWAMHWAEEAARQGMNVLILSLEMGHKDLSARTLSQISDFSLLKIIQRDLNENQRLIFEQMLEEPRYDYLNRIYIETFGDYEWGKIYPRLLDRMIELNPKIIIVDYIQMISNSKEDERLSQVLSEVARELKLFADENSAAALVLSQLNREAYKNTRVKEGETIPLSMSHIKESGGIVEAADSVQLICVPNRLETCPFHLRDKFQLTIQKSRRIGLLGTKLFNFDSERMRFI